MYQDIINRDMRMAQLNSNFNPSQTGSSVDDLLTPQQKLQQQMMKTLMEKMSG